MSPFITTLNDAYHVLVEFNIYSILFRVIIATILGSMIGSEREKHGRAAGVRTHTLVCLGSSITVMVGLYANHALGLAGDPLRVGAQVISGIGFLGAGTIMTRHHSQITGLTTAAGLWTTASLGLAIGLGFYQGALIGTIAMEITIRMFSKRERTKHTFAYYVELNNVLKINDFSDRYCSEDVSIQILQAQSGISTNVGVAIAISTHQDSKIILHQLRSIEYVVIAMPIK